MTAPSAETDHRVFSRQTPARGQPAMLLFLLPVSLIHELPDGVVDQAIQVTVRAERIEVSYRVGLNDTTASQHLAELSSDKPAATDPDEMMLRYQKRMLREMASHLDIRLNGQPVKLVPVSVEPSPRHHVRFVCKYELPLEWNQEKITLTMVDRNFTKLQGFFRRCLKGKGVEVQQSNVPILLVRDRRVDLSKLAAEDRQKAVSINAVLVAPK